MTGCVADWRIWSSGIWRAIVCVFTPARLSVPLPPTESRSKIRPTSIANGSSLGPTKALTPFGRVVMAPALTGS